MQECKPDFDFKVLNETRHDRLRLAQGPGRAGDAADRNHGHESL